MTDYTYYTLGKPCREGELRAMLKEDSLNRVPVRSPNRDIYSKPLGSNSVFQADGKTMIMTNNGVIPLSEVKFIVHSPIQSNGLENHNGRPAK